MPFVSTLTPDIAQKKPGDPIRSADWNQLGAEVIGVSHEVTGLSQAITNLDRLGADVGALSKAVADLSLKANADRFTGAVEGDLRVAGALAVDGAATLRQGLEVAGGALTFGNRTGQFINAWGQNFGLGIQGGTLYFRSEAYFAWHKGGAHSDGLADPGGGANLMTLTADSGLTVNQGPLSFGARLGQHINLYETAYGIGIQPAALYFRSAGNYAWYRGGRHIEERGNPGPDGTQTMYLSDNGWLYIIGQLSQTSDERVKQNLTPIAPDQSLERLMDLTVYEYEYRPEFQPAAAGQKYHGFLAQDVEKRMPEAVTIGQDVHLDNGEVIQGARSLAYNSIFTEAVGAIQALHQRLQAQEARIQQLVAQLAAVDATGMALA